MVLGGKDIRARDRIGNKNGYINFLPATFQPQMREKEPQAVVACPSNDSTLMEHWQCATPISLCDWTGKGL